VKSLFALLSLLSCTLVYSQDLSQTLLGRVVDKFDAPLSGAGITLLKDTTYVRVVSDQTGTFSFNNIQPGRYSLSVTFTGYQSSQQEILLSSSRPLIVSITLEELPSVLDEIEISANTMNPSLGEQTITIEKTLRVPANFFDPVRVITSYPGIMTANDQNNTIIIRGNSPAGLLWRVNGMDVVNPNHLANAGTFSDKPAAYGGGVNIISSQLLERTDFFSGSVPSRYGNALSGVVDMNLRRGDTVSHYTLQASVIGLDAAAEGALGKKKNTSFLVNYRYSTVGLLSAMGVKFGDEDIRFQDLSFSVDSRLPKGRRLSFFGFLGGSRNIFEHKDSLDWETDKDQYDINYTSKNFGAGLTFNQSIKKVNVSSGIAVSGNDQERNQFASPQIEAGELGVVHTDQLATKKLLFSAFGRLQAGINSTLLETGIMVNYMKDEVSQYSQADNAPAADITALLLDGFLLQPYAQWRIFLSEKWVAQTAMRYMYFTYNGTGTLEPRLSFEYFPTWQSSVKFSYNLVSQLQQAGTYLNNNRELELSKSHHLDLGYTLNTDDGFHFSSTVYYQKLFDIPIQEISSSYSAINSIETIALPDLISAGTGDNYGAEVVAEKSFFDKTYFILGGSWYRSSYQGSDEIKRSTRFDGNYTVNLTCGKEWSKVKKESQRTVGISSRVLYLGGLKESPIMPDQNSAATQYDESNAFENKLQDYFRLDLRLNWRKNKKGYTRTIAIDIQNLFNVQNEAYHYYDHVKNNITTQYQLGLIPVLVYRVDF